jgi:hypothetical protein
VIGLQAKRVLFAGLCATGLALSMSCGGGSSAPSPAPSPTPTPATVTAPGATVVVSSIVATTEYVPGTSPLSVAYWATVTVKETGGASGATIATILMHIQNRTPPVTAAERTYTVNEKITSNGSKTYTFGMVVDAATTTVLLNEINFQVKYTGDNGAAGSFSTPSSTTISAPSPLAPTPTPPPAPSGDAYSFVSASPITCVQPGNNIGACSGTIVIRVGTKWPVGTALSLNAFPGAFLYEATMNASAPTNLTFVMSSRINQAYCYDPGPINTGRPTPPAAQTYLTVQGTTITLATPIAVSCSR